jgi:hypothetical protein
MRFRSHGLEHTDGYIAEFNRLPTESHFRALSRRCEGSLGMSLSSLSSHIKVSGTLPPFGIRNTRKMFSIFLVTTCVSSTILSDYDDDKF